MTRKSINLEEKKSLFKEAILNDFVLAFKENHLEANKDNRIIFSKQNNNTLSLKFNKSRNSITRNLII